jgi:hypothetical protein
MQSLITGIITAVDRARRRRARRRALVSAGIDQRHAPSVLIGLAGPLRLRAYRSESVSCAQRAPAPEPSYAVLGARPEPRRDTIEVVARLGMDGGAAFAAFSGGTADAHQSSISSPMASWSILA